MKVGLVLPAIPTYSETFFRNKIKGLSDGGHEIILFVHHNKDKKKYEGATVVGQWPVHRSRPLRIVLTFIGILCICVKRPVTLRQFIHLERLSRRNWRNVFENIYINAHILDCRLDWLHLGFSTMGVRRENVAGAIGCRLSTSFRGYDIGVYPLHHKGCYKLLWKRLDKVHTISEDLLSKAYALGLPRHVPVAKITPAIQWSQFAIDRKGRSRSKPLKILTIARLHWKKGLEYTLEALACLWKEYKIDFQYTLIGTGMEYERLVFAAHQLDIFNKIIFAGEVRHSDISDYMRVHDIYIQYSLQEGFCNSVLEAQAARMICIVSDAEGLAENVLDDETGFVIKKRNPVKLAAKIFEVSGLDASRVNAITAAASDRVRLHFSLEQQQGQFLEFYES